MFECFTWRGEPIYDIDKWAEEHNEPMIRYKAQRNTPWGPEVREGKCPELFFSTLAMTDGWTYTRIAKIYVN